MNEHSADSRNQVPLSDEEFKKADEIIKRVLYRITPKPHLVKSIIRKQLEKVGLEDDIQFTLRNCDQEDEAILFVKYLDKKRVELPVEFDAVLQEKSNIYMERYPVISPEAWRLIFAMASTFNKKEQGVKDLDFEGATQARDEYQELRPQLLNMLWEGRIRGRTFLSLFTRVGGETGEPYEVVDIDSLDHIIEEAALLERELGAEKSSNLPSDNTRSFGM